MEESIVVLTLVDFLSNLFSIAVSITTYVLTSLGIYTIAKRRGINKPWLAWIPIAQDWTLGCISDQYRYVVKGENKSKRKILLWLNIAMIAILVIFIVLMIVMSFDVIMMAMESASEEEIVLSLLGTIGGILLMTIPLMVLSVVYSVFYYMAMYDLFTSCDPKNNVLFLVLSIVVPITHPFFVFFNRKKDLGMPPRREPVQNIPPQTGWQNPRQNWQNPHPSAYQPPQYNNWQPPQINAPAQPAPGNDGGETTIV